MKIIRRWHYVSFKSFSSSLFSHRGTWATVFKASPLSAIVNEQQKYYEFHRGGASVADSIYMKHIVTVNCYSCSHYNLPRHCELTSGTPLESHLDRIANSKRQPLSESRCASPWPRDFKTRANSQWLLWLFFPVTIQWSWARVSGLPVSIICLWCTACKALGAYWRICPLSSSGPQSSGFPSQPPAPEAEAHRAPSRRVGRACPNPTHRRLPPRPQHLLGENLQAPGVIQDFFTCRFSEKILGKKTKTKTKNDTRELSIPLLSLSGNPFAPPLFCFKVSGEGGIQGKNNLK